MLPNVGEEKNDLKKRRYSVKKPMDTAISANQAQKKSTRIGNFTSPMEFNNQKALNVTKQMELIPYDEAYENSERFFVYFISRIAVVYDPTTNEQRFYEGHRAKITAMTIHPSSRIFIY